MTASNNPAEYQGLKFSTSNGAAAPPEVTKQIEANIRTRIEQGWTIKTAVVGTYKCKTFAPRPSYVKQLQKLIDFDTIRKGKLKVAVELMYGTGRGYLDALLGECGAKLTVFDAEPNPLFGGHHPEPNAEGMKHVREAIAKGKATLGLGLDGDADRFGIVDKEIGRAHV